MKRLFKMTRDLSYVANRISGMSLMILMLLTVADVILRFFGRPILGTYDLVCFLGVIVFGLALPFTSLMRRHVFVDFLILRMPKRLRHAFNFSTRCMVIFLFLWIGWNLIGYGRDLQEAGEVSATLRLPFYLVVYVLGASCFGQCLVVFCDIVQILRGEYE